MQQQALQGSVLLFKFGRREHLEQFRKQGLLFMNSQDYFAELETADSVRSDRFETTDRIVQPNELKRLTIESNTDGRTITIMPKDLAGPLRIGLGSERCNIYCMFGIADPSVSPLVDERNFKFGDSFIMVLNTQEFVDRVCAAARAANLGWEFGFIEYFDATGYSGETGPFRKPSYFAYQNEFRLVVRPGSTDPIKLRVGSLTDITTGIYPLPKVNELVGLELAAATDASLTQ